MQTIRCNDAGIIWSLNVNYQPSNTTVLFISHHWVIQLDGIIRIHYFLLAHDSQAPIYHNHSLVWNRFIPIRHRYRPAAIKVWWILCLVRRQNNMSIKILCDASILQFVSWPSPKQRSATKMHALLWRRCDVYLWYEKNSHQHTDISNSFMFIRVPIYDSLESWILSHVSICP